ncbi:BTAD domain-containing putative transcriptional regulator, partial [Kitasatospora sp. A2-31]|uniref:BTAD domain-containing putative transcriptional regulator n=1 Tax=Kitasatospora sp. A2-31 TaxID=2916414 RepID=UPI001EEF3D71
MIVLKVLGSFRVEVDGRTVDTGGRLARMVLVQLLLARGAVVPTERIIERLWPERVPSSAQTSLHAYIARLRRVLEPDRAPRTPARLLVSAPYGYALAVEQDAVDAWAFEHRVAACSTAQLPAHTAAEGLAEALATWGGQPYAEFSDEPWTAGERARLEEVHRTARERLAAARLGCGQAAQALADAGMLTREQPLHEEGWRLLALALWARDRQGDALAALRRARHVLGEELGVEPGPALLELEQALLHQRLDVLHRATGTPAAAPARTGTSTAPVPTRSPNATFGSGSGTGAGTGSGGRTPTVLTADRLLGRDEELAGLAAAADRARTGRAQVVLVSGEAGIGKSSLLEAAVRQLPPQGWLVGTGHCPETDGAPPGRAWFDMLPTLAQAAPPGPYADELAPLLAPGTTSDTGQPDGSPARRFRLHKALLGWLRETALRRPLAIVLDDLHRGDQESIELYLLCAEHLRDVPLLLVGSYRTGEGDLTGALARLAACSPLRLALTGLSDAQAVELLRRGAADMSDHAAVALAERAGGNPFYLRESSLLMAGEGEQQALARVPQGVQDVLRRRLALLAPTVTAGLRLAAVAGREAPVALLVHAADSDADQLLDALDAGVTAGLLTEPRPGTVRFTHALVRDALEGALPPPAAGPDALPPRQVPDRPRLRRRRRHGPPPPAGGRGGDRRRRPRRPPRPAGLRTGGAPLRTPERRSPPERGPRPAHRPSRRLRRPGRHPAARDTAGPAGGLPDPDGRRRTRPRGTTAGRGRRPRGGPQRPADRRLHGMDRTDTLARPRVRGLRPRGSRGTRQAP